MNDLPDGWEWSTIGNIADVALGRQRSPENHSGPNMRPYLRAANVTWGGIDLSDVKEMNFDSRDAATFALRPGDLLLNEASGSPNEVGKPAIWRGEIDGCCFQNTLLRVRTRGPLVEYLYWYCLHVALGGGFGEAGRGVNIRHLGKEGLVTFPIPLPGLDEQKRVVAAIEDQLSRLDAASRALQHLNDRIEALRWHLIEESMRHSTSMTTLSDVAAPSGITDGPFGSKLKSSHYTSHGARVIRLENIGLGEFIDERTYIASDYFEQLRKHEVLPGDLLVASLVSDRLRACIAPANVGPAIVKADCIRVRLADGVDHRYVNYALMRQAIRAFVSEHVRGVGRSRLGLANVRRLPIPIAPLEVQRAVADELDKSLTVVRRVVDQQRDGMRKAQTLRRAILAAAFSGRLQ